jgi:hypothetical protein
MSKSFALKAMMSVACVAALVCSTASAREGSLAEETGLADAIVQDAAAYQAYVTKAAAVETSFKDGNGVRRTLKTGAAYEPAQLDSGEIAFAALIALQDKGFTASVKDMARDPRLRREMSDRFARYPEAVFDVPGAERAAARASAVLTGQARKVMEAGAAVKQSAYDVQRSAWSKGAVTDRPQRLAQVKQLSVTRFAITPQDSAKLVKAVDEFRDRDDTHRSGAASSAVVRGTALAALAVMGRAGEDNAETVKALLKSDSGARCLKWAKMNLYQCLAVAVPRYEDLFCAGVHALSETGQCLSDAAQKPIKSRWAGDDRAGR